MQTLDEYLDDLKVQERELLLRLAAVQSSIDSLTRGQFTPPPAAPPEPQGPQCPSLDYMRIRDAINVYLSWRRDQGLPPATLGELERELAKHNVVSFRNEPMSGMKYKWKSLSNVLGRRNLRCQNLWLRPLSKK